MVYLGLSRYLPAGYADMYPRVVLGDILPCADGLMLIHSCRRIELVRALAVGYPYLCRYVPLPAVKFTGKRAMPKNLAATDTIACAFTGRR